MSELLIYPHLGLGDGIILNAAVRYLAAQHSATVVLCKPHNIHTLAFQWRDVTSLELFSVLDDKEAGDAFAEASKAGFHTISIGGAQFISGGAEKFDVNQWDREFYQIVGIAFQDRWSKFTVARQPSRELDVPTKPYALIHEDTKRGFFLDRARLPKKLPHIAIDPARTANLFDYWGLIENATELHFMESSPAILADSLPLIKASRKVLHHYTRASIAPTYQMTWEHER